VFAVALAAAVAAATSDDTVGSAVLAFEDNFKADDWSEFIFLEDLGAGGESEDESNDAEEDDGNSPIPTRSVRSPLRGGCPKGCSRDGPELFDVFE
jgi:hypothetical protein